MGAALAGLVTLAATTADWFVDTGARQVGGIPIAQLESITGAELRPGLMLIGLVLLLAAVPIGVARGRLKRVVGAAVAVIGVVGAGLTLATVFGAADVPGALQSSVWVALAGSLAGAASGLLAVGRPHRGATLPARFDVGSQSGAGHLPGDVEPPAAKPDRGAPEDEWEMAADEARDNRGTN